jgi:hypothetical protein
MPGDNPPGGSGLGRSVDDRLWPPDVRRVVALEGVERGVEHEHDTLGAEVDEDL